MTGAPAMFPILKSDGAVIPWRLIAPHEPQAIRNHNQSLARLASRGGLSWCEAAAVLEDRPWRPMPDETAFVCVMGHIVEDALAQKHAADVPEIEDFVAGVLTEAEHQKVRWGDAHDRDKSAENWFWLVGYLGGKALRAAVAGERDKALHHTISTAAALSQWHAAIKRDASGTGVGADADLMQLGKGEAGE